MASLALTTPLNIRFLHPQTPPPSVSLPAPNPPPTQPTAPHYSSSRGTNSSPPQPQPQHPPVWQGAAMKPLLATIATGVILWFIPAPGGVSRIAWQLLSIFLATIIGIISQPLPLGAVARPHKDPDLRGGLWRPYPVADRARLLLRPRLHKNWAREPDRLPVRLPLRELLLRTRLQLSPERGPPGPSDPIGVGSGGRDLPAAGEVAVRGVRQQRGGRDGEEAGGVADADVLPDVGDIVIDVPDGDGGEFDGEHDRNVDRVGGLGQGGDRAGAGVVDGCGVCAVCNLSVDGEE